VDVEVEWFGPHFQVGEDWFLVDCDERMGEVEGPLEEGAQALTA
jgi:hypothetical protein